MLKLSHSFQNLLKRISDYPDALSPVTLHGFLTAIAIGPETVDNYELLATVYGIDPNPGMLEELGEPVWNALDEIHEALSDLAFEPLLQWHDNKQANPAPWMDGFNQAVGLAEEEWTQLNEENIEAGKNYAFIQTLASQEYAEIFLGVGADAYPSYLAESLPYLPDALEVLYQGYRGDVFESANVLGLQDLPDFSPEELQERNDEELLETILSLGDMLPREVIDEAIQRDQPMAALLRAHLENPDNWNEEVDAGNWWGLLHAVFVLGHMSGEDATQGLLHAIQRMDTQQSNDLWDWVGGYWPVLFRNKRTEAVAKLQAIASDSSLDWYPRATAQECLLEAAQATSPEALNRKLQEIAQIVADETQDWDYRLSLTQHLLEFPRESHRHILLRLAQEQEKRETFPHYGREEVDEAYTFMEDRPEWARFKDPLDFYAPLNILNRQNRWPPQDESPLEEAWLKADEDEDEPGYAFEPNPYAIDPQRVDRNAPCPCGSGKQYKICCLKKLH